MLILLTVWVSQQGKITSGVGTGFPHRWLSILSLKPRSQQLSVNSLFSCLATRLHSIDAFFSAIKSPLPELLTILSEAKLRDVIRARLPLLLRQHSKKPFSSLPIQTLLQPRKREANKMSANTDAKIQSDHYRVCQNCNSGFDTTANDVEACANHPEHAEADHNSDFWIDHHEGTHGMIEEFRDEMPEGFIHSCCGKDATHNGCKTGNHVAKP